MCAADGHRRSPPIAGARRRTPAGRRSSCRTAQQRIVVNCGLPRDQPREPGGQVARATAAHSDGRVQRHARRAASLGSRPFKRLHRHADRRAAPRTSRSSRGATGRCDRAAGVARRLRDRLPAWCISARSCSQSPGNRIDGESIFVAPAGNIIPQTMPDDIQSVPSRIPRSRPTELTDGTWRAC